MVHLTALIIYIRNTRMSCYCYFSHVTLVREPAELVFRRQEMAEEVRSEQRRHTGRGLNGRKSEQRLIRLQENSAAFLSQTKGAAE